ncbi:hypothetical protein HD554DRAFT_1847843 [Boletus coccyginus]|nr:hypothetical protein HD554DRAFT_1847843 [Boletus coccyginus]
MTEAPFQQTLLNLQRFAALVRDNPQAVLKRSEDIEFIDLGEFKQDLRLLFGWAAKQRKILVRDEYRTALQTLDTDFYCDGAFVIGQPGIGKTFFLVYALVVRLANRQPVAVQFGTAQPIYALFAEDTVAFYSFQETPPLSQHSPMWVLFDSNGDVLSPNPIFCLEEKNRVIMATSPKKDRWKEWSKQSGSQPYVMDIWSEQEVRQLATLMEKDVDRMITLAKRWGGVPRTLLECIGKADWNIMRQYRQFAKNAVQQCGRMMAAAELFDTPSDPPSQFYFFRPLVVSQDIVRTNSYVYVPTRKLRSLLGEALQGNSNTIKLGFFNTMSQPEETRQAAGFIFESWFHSFLAAAGTIQCQWTRSRSRPSLLEGVTTLIPATRIAPKSAEPPYYWVAPKKFPGIDSALVFAEEIIAFQVTLRSEHESPMKGLQTLRENLPDELKDVQWRVVFVGQAQMAIEAVAKQWSNMTWKKKGARIPVAWCVVDPVQDGITYQVCGEVC